MASPEATAATQSTFPIPKDKVALLDIDGTLISTSYEVTDTRIYAAIQEAQDAGWVLGLSSDTPYTSMVEWAEQFGVKEGPLISEKGARVTCRNWSEETVPNLSDAFRTSKERIIDHLSSMGLLIRRGNPAEALNDKVGSPGDAVVLVNDRRQYSMGFFFRLVNTDGALVRASELTDYAVGEMRHLYPDFDDLQEDKDHDYGILIVNRKLVTKRLGTRALMEEMGLQQIAMIGNSSADYLGDDIALHYAVGNSGQEYKATADYVASTEVTSGALEILQQLAR